MTVTITPTEELIARLEEIQTERDMSNREFAEELLRGAVSRQTWNQIRARSRPLSLRFLRGVRTHVRDAQARKLAQRVLDEDPTIR